MSEKPVDRQALIEAARRGDRAALGELLGELRPQLVTVAAGTVHRYLLDKTDASDIVQLGLAEACKSFADFRGHSAEELKAWLATIVRNEALNQVRFWNQERRSVRLEQSPGGNESGSGRDPAAKDSTPSSQVARREQAEQVVAQLKSLPDDQRTALELRHLQGMSLQQIAEQLGRTPGAVAGLLKRGAKRVRDQLLLERRRRADEHGQSPESA